MTYFVYVIECGPYAKVGHASNVQQRVSDMRTGNPFDMAVAHAFRFQHRYLAIAGERHAHSVLKSHHHKGEWFSIPAAKAVSALDGEFRRKFEQDGDCYVGTRDKPGPQTLQGFLEWAAHRLAGESAMPDIQGLLGAPPAKPVFNPVAEAELRIAWVGALRQKLLRHRLLLNRWDNKTSGNFQLLCVLPDGVCNKTPRYRWRDKVLCTELERIAGRRADLAVAREWDIKDLDADTVRGRYVPDGWWNRGCWCAQGEVFPSESAVSALVAALASGADTDTLRAIATHVDPCAQGQYASRGW